MLVVRIFYAFHIYAILVIFGKITNFFLIKEIFAGFLLNFYLDSMLTIFFDTIIFVVFFSSSPASVFGTRG